MKATLHRLLRPALLAEILHKSRARGADAANTQALAPFTGGARLIQNHLVSEDDTRRWAWVLLLLLVPAGLLIIYTQLFTTDPRILESLEQTFHDIVDNDDLPQPHVQGIDGAPL